MFSAIFMAMGLVSKMEPLMGKEYYRDQMALEFYSLIEGEESQEDVVKRIAEIMVTLSKFVGDPEERSALMQEAMNMAEDIYWDKRAKEKRE